MLKRVKGNLIKQAFEGDYDVIVHGCNCWNNMGAGIALTIAANFPLAAEADYRTKRGDYNKLGTYTKAEGFTKTDPVVLFTIVNAYTQFGFDARKGRDMFEYTAFDLILEKLLHEFPGARIGFPYIGMGLASGDSAMIISSLEYFAHEMTKTSGEVTLVEFQM